MHKWYMTFLECLCIELDWHAWDEQCLGVRNALKNKTMALVRFDREIILAQKAFDMAECVRNSPITGDSEKMNKPPMLLSFQGAMYVRADKFVKPLQEPLYRGGLNKESIVKIQFPDGTWFECGDQGYKAWPASEALKKVGEVEPVDTLDQISSAIGRNGLAEGLTAAIQGEQAMFEPQAFTLVNNGTINIGGGSVGDAKVKLSDLALGIEWTMNLADGEVTIYDCNGAMRLRGRI